MSTTPLPPFEKGAGAAGNGAPTSTCRSSSTISGQFRTTRFAIEDGLRFHKQKPLSRHLEVETYTWDVLPDNLKKGDDIVDNVCRELEWVKGQLSWIPFQLLLTGDTHESRIHRAGPHGLGHGLRRLIEGGHEVGVYNRTHGRTTEGP